MPFLISSSFCIGNVLSSLDVGIDDLPNSSLKWSCHSLISYFPLFALHFALFELYLPLTLSTIFQAKADMLLHIA